MGKNRGKEKVAAWLKGRTSAYDNASSGVKLYVPQAGSAHSDRRKENRKGEGVRRPSFPRIEKIDKHKPATRSKILVAAKKRLRKRKSGLQ